MMEEKEVGVSLGIVTVHHCSSISYRDNAHCSRHCGGDVGVDRDLVQLGPQLGRADGQSKGQLSDNVGAHQVRVHHVNGDVKANQIGHISHVSLS